MKGLPTYTQHSVAWPQNPRSPRVLDDIHISFVAKGGGTYGEFTFEWIELMRNTSLWPGSDHKERDPRYPHGALRIKVFTDGLPAFLDDRVQRVVKALKRLPEDRRNVSPEKLIVMLEAGGIRPSQHHLLGLIEVGQYADYAERRRFEDEISRQRKREEAR